MELVNQAVSSQLLFSQLEVVKSLECGQVQFNVYNINSTSSGTGQLACQFSALMFTT